MKKKDGFGHETPFGGESNDWITPKWIIDGFDIISWDRGMFFDLDPCISMTQPWLTARNGYNEEQDGLLHEWYDTVWCNPPYGINVGVWAQRMAKHGDGVMLIFARTETGVWQDDIFTTANGFLFLRGRIVFHKPDGSFVRNKKGQIASAGAPSVFVSWGDVSTNALIKFSEDGMLDEFGVMRTGHFLHNIR